jgi:hypothetical protein
MPRIAVNMMVLNAGRVLRRCLLPLKGVVDELVVVDTGSTDDTEDVVRQVASDVGIVRCYCERMDPASDDFITDEASTWEMPVPGPFTGRRVPGDWAAVRNRALDATTADYVVKLDADDEPVSPPENWRKAADFLDLHTNLDLVGAPYEVCDGRGEVEWLSMYDRMWRRAPSGGSPSMRWTVPFHEYLNHKTPQNTVYAPQGLRVRDWRDSPGEGVRIEHRNLKVLLWNWERGGRRLDTSSGDIQAGRPGELQYCDYRSSLVETFTLAHEAVQVFPEFARTLLEYVVRRLPVDDVGMLSDCYYHLARALEQLGDHVGAMAEYEVADETSPHTQALLRLFCLCERLEEVDMCEDVKKKVLLRVGGRPGDPRPYNCDLKVVSRLRGGGGA